MLAETLMSLAELAGLTVVAAAVTDSWEAARRGFTRVLSRGDSSKEKLAEQRLGETREQLIGGAGRRFGAGPRLPGRTMGWAPGGPTRGAPGRGG